MTSNSVGTDDLAADSGTVPNSDPMGGHTGDEVSDVDVALVTLHFDAADARSLAPVLANYVVRTRRIAGCRNVDFCGAAGRENRFVIIEKWTSAAAQRAHLDSEIMVTMAESCRGLLASAPSIELLEPISAHDIV